ncbi:MAG: aminotransferase class IV, partial [Desulfomonilaceae bacterium]
AFIKLTIRRNMMLSFQRDHFVNSEDLVFPYCDDISGTLRGYRIFTACGTVNGKIFRLEDHLNRLYKSAEQIYMQPPCSRVELTQILSDLVDRNQRISSENQIIDIIFSGGLKDETMKQSGKGAHLYVVAQPMVTPPLEFYENGVTLATFSHQRMLPGVKLLNYIGAVIAHQTVVPKYQAYDTVFICPQDNKTILEGSTFSVFFVLKDGEIVTPPMDGRILDSVTRRVLLELLRPSKNITITEEPVTLDQFPDFEEAFLASTSRNVLPVIKLDDRVIGTGKPGPVTKEVMSILNEYIRAY